MLAATELRGAYSLGQKEFFPITKVMMVGDTSRSAVICAFMFLTQIISQRATGGDKDRKQRNIDIYPDIVFFLESILSGKAY